MGRFARPVQEPEARFSMSEKDEEEVIAESSEGGEDAEVLYEWLSAEGPRLRVGQLVRHKLFDYRGVIVDVHAHFNGTEEWYESNAKSKPPKDKPWYEVLVHDSNRMTYVAERNLEVDYSGMPVEHPLVRIFFNEFAEGAYRISGLTN
jgi:heat shock protein HspQ